LSGLFVIAGLGNPGRAYADTRHNAGFWFLDTVARRSGAVFRSQSRLKAKTARLPLNGRDCLLVRPTTFMNHSGEAIRAVVDYFRVPAANLLLAYDELDLPAGISRLKIGGGHGGHNGMRDVFRHLPDHDFLRLRIGIGHPGNKHAVTDYVLSRPDSSDEKLIWGAIEKAVAVLPEVLEDRLAQAMKALHTVDTED